MKTIILLFIAVCLSSCGSTRPHCPTYAQASDTTQVAPKFSNAEKTGAVLFTIFVIFAIDRNQEQMQTPHHRL